MRRSFHQAGNPHVPWLCRVAWAALAAAGTCGCAGFWDEMTSHNRDLKSYFIKPDPMVVLSKSSDGAKRGQALASLKEPLKNGGSEKDQDAYMKILTVAALDDKEPLCRLGAIRALGQCKDLRAVGVLEDLIQQRLPFPAEVSSIIRMHALTSLEETEQPEARHWLIRIAREPNATGSYQDRQQVLDERLTALRGLAKFKQYDSTETLLYVLESEKDVALRDRAHQSLQQITGKKLPAEAQAWADFLHDPNTQKAKEPNAMQRVTGWVENLLP